MSAREIGAVKRFARWALGHTDYDRHHCVQWAINRLRKGVLPV